MRTQEHNPAYRMFDRLLPPSGLYPARWVDIFSNTNENQEYEDVEVVFVPRGARDITLDAEFWDDFSDYNSRWMGDLGNSVSGWMEPGGLNPEKVFGSMLAHGFSSATVLTETIREFAAIEECEWARRIEGGQFPQLLAAFSQGREQAARALESEARHPWAEDMLDALRSEERF